MILSWPDGQLTIDATRDCAAYVEYANRFGQGPGDQFFDMGDFTVHIAKGSGTLPETLTVFDRTTGMTYALVLTEGETGRVCLPWKVMA